MTQEDKKLLLIDLCARLPYDIKGIYTKNGFTEPYDSVLTPFYYGEVEMSLEGARVKKNYVEFKPYLRPMSSMTEEEEKTLDSMCNGVEMVSRLSGLKMFDKAFDWLNKKGFDYHGLIPDLALEAPIGMYNE